jgi:predicted nucleic acid-binding protein
MAGAHEIADTLATAEAVILSPIVIGELHEGSRNGTRYGDNLRILERFRAQPRTVAVAITDATAEWFAEFKQGLRRRGRLYVCQ